MNQLHCSFILAVIGLLGAICCFAVGEATYALHVFAMTECFIKAMTAAAGSRHPR